MNQYGGWNVNNPNYSYYSRDDNKLLSVIGKDNSDIDGFQKGIDLIKSNEIKEGVNGYHTGKILRELFRRTSNKNSKRREYSLEKVIHNGSFRTLFDVLVANATIVYIPDEDYEGNALHELPYFYDINDYDNEDNAPDVPMDEYNQSIRTLNINYYFTRLLQIGIDINEYDQFGRRPIHYFVAQFGKGAHMDSNLMTEFFETVVGSSENVNILSTPSIKGIEIQTSNNDSDWGYSPLLRFIREKYYDLPPQHWNDAIETLLTAGADINGRKSTGRGETALMIASSKLDLHLVRGLVETHKADVTIEDNHGETALFYANQSIDFQRNQEDEHDAVGGVLGLNLQILLEGDEIAELRKLLGDESPEEEERIFSEKYMRPEKIYQVDTCVSGTFNDLIMLEETEYTNVNKFLEDGSDNIVIQYFINDKPKLFLTTRDTISQMHKQHEHLYYGCEKADSWGSYKKEFVFFDLKSIGLISSHPLCIFDAFFKEDPRQIYSLHYETNETIDKFETFSSVASAKPGGNVVSGWHCQTGATGKYCWLALGEPITTSCDEKQNDDAYTRIPDVEKEKKTGIFSTLSSMVNSTGGRVRKNTIKKRTKQTKRNSKKRTYKRKKR